MLVCPLQAEVVVVEAAVRFRLVVDANRLISLCSSDREGHPAEGGVGGRVEQQPGHTQPVVHPGQAPAR